jgi:hypothetical protein
MIFQRKIALSDKVKKLFGIKFFVSRYSGGLRSWRAWDRIPVQYKFFFSSYRQKAALGSTHHPLQCKIGNFSFGGGGGYKGRS